MANRKQRSDRSSGALDHVGGAALLDEIESRIEAAVWVQELDPLRTIRASNAYEAIWGRSLDALYRNPRDWIEAVHPEDRPRVEAAYERLLRGEAFDQRYRILRPDGEVRWVRDRGSPLRTAWGISQVAGIAEDVTGSVETERALRLMSSVFSDAADPILIVDLAGTVIDCNAAAQRTYGFGREELLGETVKAVVPRECHARADELLERCRAGEEVRNAEGLCWNKRGDVIPMLLTLSLLIDEQGQPLGIAAIAKDISALKEAESQRRAASRAAEDAEARERRALACDLHDAVSQSLALARTKLAALRIESATTTDAAGRLRDIEALVADAEERTRTLTFRLSPPTLHDVGLAAALEWLAEDLVRRSGLHVVVSDDGLPKPLGAQAREALFRSVRELLINVARHARTDKASVSLIREDDAVAITVGDEGIGFDRGLSGGFGLLSVRERVEGLGGRLEIESEPHRGTRVRMVVPLCRDRVRVTDGGETFS